MHFALAGWLPERGEALGEMVWVGVFKQNQMQALKTPE